MNVIHKAHEKFNDIFNGKVAWKDKWIAGFIAGYNEAKAELEEQKKRGV